MSTATPKAREVKAETPLGQTTTKLAQAYILKQKMFYRFQGARPEQDDKLRAAFKKRFGRNMRQFLEHERVPAVYLEGPPGHGKTTAHRGAGKEFAQLMELTFHEDVTQAMLIDGKIGMNSFVFSIIELAGETSNKEVFGLMTKVKVGDHQFMGHLPDWRIAATMFSGYGYVLFDDFATATHQVQNSTLGLLMNGSAGDLQFNLNELGTAKVTMDKDGITPIVELSGDTPRPGSSTVHFGLAGNRGARDGNKTFSMTTATATRIERMDIEDTVELYVNRIMEMNNDDIGDCHFSSLISQNEELFSKLAKLEKGMISQMPVPRTWDAFLVGVRTEFAELGGLGEICKLGAKDVSELLYSIEKRGQFNVGKEAAAAAGAFYNALFLGAAPIADAIIRKGEVDKTAIDKKYNGGNDAMGQNFGFSLASALASFAAEDITKIIGRTPSAEDVKELANPESKKSIAVRKVFEHFSYGVNQFTNLSMCTFSANQLLRRLAVSTPSLFTGSGEYRVPTVEAATLLAHGMFIDNKKHRVDSNTEELANALSTYSAVFEGSFEKDMSGKIKAALGK